MSTIAHAKMPDVTKMEFDAETASGHTVILDAKPEVGGEEKGPRPAEMQFVGLAGCTGMDAISILRKMRQPIDSFSVEVEGVTRTTEHPKMWTEIRVIFHATGEVDRDKLQRAIDLSRGRYCSVSTSLKPTVTIHYRYILNGESVDLPDEPTL